MTSRAVSTRTAFPPDGSSSNSVAERERAGRRRRRRRRRRGGLVNMLVPSLLRPPSHTTTEFNTRVHSAVNSHLKYYRIYFYHNDTQLFA